MASNSDTLHFYQEPVWFRVDSLISPARASDTPAVVDTINSPSSEFAPAKLFSTSRTEITDSIHPEERQSPDKDWLYGVFALLLIMIVLLRLLYSRDINKLLRSMLFPGKPATDNRIFDFRPNLFAVFFLLIHSITIGLLVLSFVEGYGLFPGFSLNSGIASSIFSAPVPRCCY